MVDYKMLTPGESSSEKLLLSTVEEVNKINTKGHFVLSKVDDKFNLSFFNSDNKLISETIDDFEAILKNLKIYKTHSEIRVECESLDDLQLMHKAQSFFKSGELTIKSSGIGQDEMHYTIKINKAEKEGDKPEIILDNGTKKDLRKALIILIAHQMNELKN